MKKRTLGRTGLEVSVIGFGGIPIQGIAPEEAAAVLHRALDRGVNFIDTARGYTDSEVKIGAALEGRREGVHLATKSMAREAEAMREEIRTSLTNLRTDRIDLYQLHGVGNDATLDRVLAAGGALEALREAREAGRIGHIGITGHSRPVLKRAVETGWFDTVQLPFNPIEDRWLEDAIPAARAMEVGIIGMKPVAGGAIDNVPAGLRFALDLGVDLVIPGMDSVAQVDENTAVGRHLHPPTEDDLAALQDTVELWSGRFCRRCGYCMPCPEGLQIPFLLLIEAYYTRYGLQDWALERLAGLEKGYGACTGCGVCLERCPYELPIPEMMAVGADKVK